MIKDEFAAKVDRIAQECVAVRLRMLNRVVTNVYDEALRPLDVKVSQINIMVAAAKMGVVRPTDLGEVLHLDASTLSRNLERMQARGWLEVVHNEEDGRSQPVRLTAQGRKLLERAALGWDAAQAKVKKLLGTGTVEQIAAAAQRLGGPSKN
jgi:DNA-binding MarR family transcriptional regulator